MKEKTCCFTGHRYLTEKESIRIKDKLKSIIEALIKSGVVFFGSGGALGFDTLAALTVLELKKEYPYIKLIMVYPCENQTAFWTQKDKFVYDKIRKSCDKYVFISEKYNKHCMHKRNRHLVDYSSYCVCYLKRETGGTVYTVNYAKQKGLTIINIADN